MANGVQFPGENVRQWTLLGGGKGGAVGGRRGTMKGTLFWGSSLNAWISCSSRKYIPYPAIRGHFTGTLSPRPPLYYLEGHRRGIMTGDRARKVRSDYGSA